MTFYFFYPTLKKKCANSTISTTIFLQSLSNSITNCPEPCTIFLWFPQRNSFIITGIPMKLGVQGSGQFVIELLNDCRKIVGEIVEFALFFWGFQSERAQGPKSKNKIAQTLQSQPQSFYNRWVTLSQIAPNPVPPFLAFGKRKPLHAPRRGTTPQCYYCFLGGGGFRCFHRKNAQFSNIIPLMYFSIKTCN